MRVIMFQDRFAELVRRGLKQQTIRKSTRCNVGEMLSLRRWSGKPYRSKQKTLRESVCVDVLPVSIYCDGVRVDGRAMPSQYMAVLDGFRDWSEMREWFEKVHGLPFDGWLITWRDAP